MSGARFPDPRIPCGVVACFAPPGLSRLSASLQAGIVALCALLAGCGPAFLPQQARFTVEPCEAIAAAGLPKSWDVRSEPALAPGPPGAWDSVDALNPSVVRLDGRYLNVYSGFDGETWRSGLATSPDGVQWRKSDANPVLAPELDWEGDYIAANGSVVAAGDEELVYWYQAGPRGAARLGLARSDDGGRTWRKRPEPVLGPGPRRSWDEAAVADPYVFRCGDEYTLYYLGQDEHGVQRLGAARSPDGVHWQKSHLNPLLEPGGPGEFDERGLGEPAVFFAEGEFWMLYVGRDARERRRVGWARSDDGVRWTKAPERGLLSGGAEWDQAVFCDPTIVVEPGRLLLWYGGGDRPSPDENLNGAIGFAVAPLAP